MANYSKPLNKTGVIYMLIAPNGQVYVGQTIQNIKDRWYQHEYCAKLRKKRGCRLLTQAINQYGFNNFQKEILLYYCDIKYLNMWESAFIKYYNSLAPNGLNLTKGGSRRAIYSNQSREQMSNMQRKNTTHYEYTKDLPPHIFIKVRNEKIVGFGVRDRDRNLYKTFANRKNNVEKNKMYALCYLNTGKYDDLTYDEFSKSYIPPKPKEIPISEPEIAVKKRELPKNIYYSERKGTNKKGYEVRIKKDKKILIRKQFLSQISSMKEKLQKAIDFLNLYIKEHQI
jgi:group I intron endonuclease